MKVTVNGIRKLAIESGIPESVADRYTDQLITFALNAASRERRIAKRVIRAWFFDKSPTKLPLFEVLDNTDEDLV